MDDRVLLLLQRVAYGTLKQVDITTARTVLSENGMPLYTYRVEYEVYYVDYTLSFDNGTWIDGIDYAIGYSVEEVVERYANRRQVRNVRAFQMMKVAA